MEPRAASTPPDDSPAVRLLAEAAITGVKLGAQDPSLISVERLGDHLVELEQLICQLQGVAGEWADTFEGSGGPGLAGACSLAAWMRHHLRLTSRRARGRVQAGQT